MKPALVDLMLYIQAKRPKDSNEFIGLFDSFCKAHSLLQIQEDHRVFNALHDAWSYKWLAFMGITLDMKMPLRHVVVPCPEGCKITIGEARHA